MALCAGAMRSRRLWLAPQLECLAALELAQQQQARPLFGRAAPPSPAEPLVPARPAQRSCGGHEWSDEYSWLERGGAEVQRVLRREARHAERWLARSAPLADAMHAEMVALAPGAQVSAPERVGGHEYWVQQLGGAPLPAYMRRPAAAAAGSGQRQQRRQQQQEQDRLPPPEAVLDLNELAGTHGEYVQVGQMKLSRCGGRLAFTLDAGGGEESLQAFTRDLRTGRLAHVAALGGVASLEWAADGRTLLATQPNALGRPCRVVACDAGAGGGAAGRPLFGAAPRTLWEEADERFFVELGRTKDWSYLIINSNSKRSSEVHLLPASLRTEAAGAGAATAAGAAEARLVQARRPGLEYFAEHNAGQLYLLSNARGADSYAVFRVPTCSPSLSAEHWAAVVPEQPGVANEDMDMSRDWLLLYQRHQGRQAVAALPLRDGLPAAEQPAPPLQLAPLPAWALSVAAGANADFESPSLRLMLSSPVHPEAAFDWAPGSGQLVPRSAAASGVPAAAAAATEEAQQQREQRRQLAGLAWRQVWATSRDGTRVPLTVAHAAAEGCGGSELSELRPPPAPRPCLLVVYGAYGHCLPTEFLAERIPLLRRGWVLALAHARGGGELGRRWHAGARGAAKGATVDDLEACLDHLIAQGYTRPGLVALEAHSAGGLAAGGLLNRRPADVGAALLEAPFVDVLSAMSRPELPLTVAEYEEWGDPAAGGQAFEQVSRICPYQGVRPAPYPPTLLTCSQDDQRVPFWGPLKHAARLRAAVQAHAATAGTSGGGQQRRSRGGPILLLPDDQAGHFVHERDLYRTKAQQYAFLAASLEGVDGAAA